MKTFVQAAGIFLIIVLTIVFMATKFSGATSETELEAALDNALEHALYVSMSKNTYTINNEDEVAADVMHELFTSLNAKADYEIAFNVIDIENGIIDVQVTQTIKTFPLIKSKVSCRKTIILESATVQDAA